MKPLDFYAECPKCGGGTPQLSQHAYCWSNNNRLCYTWRSFGGEHLHRECFDCHFVYSVLTKDFSKSRGQADEEWLNKKVDDAIDSYESNITLLTEEEIDWETPFDGLGLP